MLLKRLFAVTAVFLTTLLGLTSVLQIASATPKATSLLYDSSQNNTPSEQNFTYRALNTQPPFTAQASQIYSAPVTVLNTANQLNDYAGYTVSPTVMPSLNRATGIWP